LSSRNCLRVVVGAFLSERIFLRAIVGALLSCTLMSGHLYFSPFQFTTASTTDSEGMEDREQREIGPRTERSEWGGVAIKCF